MSEERSGATENLTPDQSNAESNEKSKGSRWARPLRWLADHLLGSIVGFVVTLALGAAVFALWGGGAHGDDWPDGENAWTVVLASETSRGQAEAAVNRARSVPTGGLNLGVLNSDDYSRLSPGYWVAFAGQFDSAEEAAGAASRYKRVFPTAYQRFIEEK